MQNNVTEKRLQEVKQEIFRELRLERDQKRELTQTGTIDINPQLFIDGREHVIGPIHFNTKFKNVPYMGFGDVNHNLVNNTFINVSSESTLFLVHEYVERWLFTTGVVEGFYLGLYPITTVPIGVKSHTIMWIAYGEASYYRSRDLTDAWTHAYDNTESTGLIQNPSDVPTTDADR